ncbi:hypothetical protein [Streptomyces sp. NBC_01216]|uniref:hypothetical protein n=1 Tax=unclassified Streptomyces TaxID=2593676 RepID=UPI002E150FA2|nr:hypothetical protein OG393_26620 [Streptomyces sp. NBC_01216]
MNVPMVRPLLSTALAAVAVGGGLLAGASSADAAVGDGGDIKIQRTDTDPDTRADHARVCRFHLAAFNFETLREVDWEIAPQPQTAGATSGGRITLRGGMGHTGDMDLAEGRYRLTWTFDDASEPGKEKGFRVDCDSDPTGARPDGDGGDGGGGGGDGGSSEAGAYGSGRSGAEGGAAEVDGPDGAPGRRGDPGDGDGVADPRADRAEARSPHGPVGAGGGGVAEVAAEGDSAVGAASALAAGLAGAAVLMLVRRSRRRADGAA